MILWYPNLAIDAQRTTSKTTSLYCRDVVINTGCDICGQETGANFHRHGSIEIKVPDAPIAGRRVVLIISKERFRCARCNQTFSAEGSTIDPEFRMTSRLRHHIQRQLSVRSSAELAEQFEIDEKTVRAIMQSAVSRNLPGVEQRKRGERLKRVVLEQCQCCLGSFPDGALQTEIFTGLRSARRSWTLCATCREVKVLDWAGWKTEKLGAVNV